MLVILGKITLQPTVVYGGQDVRWTCRWVVKSFEFHPGWSPSKVLEAPSFKMVHLSTPNLNLPRCPRFHDALNPIFLRWLTFARFAPMSRSVGVTSHMPSWTPVCVFEF